jgi:hypothetical protein
MPPNAAGSNDTLLAATYYRGGVQRVATTNWRDFARYGVFEVIGL